jgi:hypothetical protein
MKILSNGVSRADCGFLFACGVVVLVVIKREDSVGRRSVGLN